MANAIYYQKSNEDFDIERTRGGIKMNKTEIIRKADELVYDDRMAVLKIIIKLGYKICDGSDGSRVNLDLFTHEHLDELSQLIHKLSVVAEVDKM